VEAGSSLGLGHAGAFAFDAARVERGFRSWGHDIGPLDDPFAAGLGFAVSRKKATDYVGRDALEGLRDAPHERRLVSVHVPDGVLWHGESVVRGEARMGHLTSAAIAATLGGSAGLAWIHGEPEGEGWGVEIRGEVVPAVVRADPFYDPRGERLRG
jgi:glycine cleavage system aminomethyltransferase T